MNKDFSYLDQLTFDPALTRTRVAAYLTNIRFALLIVLTIVGVGVVSFLSLPKRLNPEIDIPIVFVSTVFPGASPTDVESLITIPLEDELNSVEGLTTLSSTSREGASFITLEFSSTTDVAVAKTEVQDRVDEVTDLPDDALTPRIQALDFEDQAVWLFVLSMQSDTDPASLAIAARELEDALESVPVVDRVTRSGLSDDEIQVLINPAALRTYNITSQDLARAISAARTSFPAGSVQTPSTRFAVTIDPAVATVEDLRSLVVTIHDTQLPLSDIATITQRQAPGASVAYVHDLHANEETATAPAVVFSVFKAGSANIDRVSADAHAVVTETLAPYNGQFRIDTILDNGVEITKQFDELVGNFRSTIILVFITLLLFLGAKQASVVALSIPLTFLVSFSVMNAMGMSVNFLSLFSLLLGLGLLVDDAIVMVSAVTRYYRSGKFTPHQAGLLAWRDFIVPIWTTTITTVWAFVPLLLSTGIIGEFIKPIPIIVSTTLLVSTTIAVFLTLPFTVALLEPRIPRRVRRAGVIALLFAVSVLFSALFRSSAALPLMLLTFVVFQLVSWRVRHTVVSRFSQWLTTHVWTFHFPVRRFVSRGFVDVRRLRRRYEERLGRILRAPTQRRRTILMVVVFALFSYTLVPLGFVVNEFFPKADFELVYIGLELPPGTTERVTQEEALQLLPQIHGTPEALFATVETSMRVGEDGVAIGGEEHQAVITLRLTPLEERAQQSFELVEALQAQFDSYEAGSIIVSSPSGGPPAGADVQIKIVGADLTVLDQLADRVVTYLASQEGVIAPRKSIIPGTGALVFAPDTARLAELGITQADIGVSLRTAASGVTLDDLIIDGTTHDIVLRTDNVSLTPESLETITIQTPVGPQSLNALGEVRLAANPTSITREGGARTMSVSASVLPDYSISTINTELQAFADDELALPLGYSWQTGGVNEENQRSVISIIQAMGLAAVLILVTMVVQLGSFRKALIVLLVIPLAISGVFVVFALTGTPLSFPSLIGLLALFGIVVNNSIVIVDKINQNRSLGAGLMPAIIDGAGSRLTPILLSSITTIMGLLPITLSDPLWRGLGGAIIAGLLFSGAIMLLFIPVVYYVWFREDEQGEKVEQLRVFGEEFGTSHGL